MKSGDWDEVFEEVEAEHFVGRHEELASFRQQISLSKPRYLIFYITGQGGVGKTTLLNHFKELAKDYGYLLADCDEHQRDVPVVLGHFAQQLTEQSFPLKRFNDRYKIYRQKMHEIDSDPEAPQGLASGIVRTAVRAIFIGGDVVPGARKALEYVPRETVETQASEWATYLIRKFTNKDEVELVREPASILTPLFFEDLNEIVQKRKALLCFDNFEAASIELLEWLLRIREFKPSLNVRIIIVSRDEPGVKWDSLRSAIQTVRLDVFTHKEAEMFLDVNGITSSKRRQEILELTGRLPVLMSWLAVPGSQTNEADPSIPTHDIVDRFLRWIDDVTLKRVALLGALPRIFNADILNLLLEGLSQTVDVQSAFDWLQTMPFVKQGQTGWYYHEVVRRMMLQYQRKKSPITYHSAHSNLADFYIARSREQISSTSSNREEWTNEQWRKYMLAYIYHFLVADPVRHWTEIMNLFVIAMRKHRSFAIEVIELLNLNDVQDELSNEQKSIVQSFRQQLQAVEDAGLEDGFEMFDKLCAIADLSNQAKCYTLAYRGESHRLNDNWETAISDFDSALRYMPEDTWAMARRGQTYLEMKRYEEALADFDRRIALDEKDTWAVAQRGETYRLMERYEEALADFDRAIALNEKDAWVIGRRGEVYGEIRRYKEALADFDQAIVLDNKSAWIIKDRGIVYFLMGQYKEALADFNQVVGLDEKNDWYRYLRAHVYLTTGRVDDYTRDICDAIEFVQLILNETPSDWQSNFNLALYKLLAGHSDTEVLYDQLASMCSSLSALQEAIDDLKDFMLFQMSHELAQGICIRLQVRKNEIQVSFTK